MLYKLIREESTSLEHSVISLTTRGDLGSTIDNLGVPVRTLGLRKERLRPQALFSLGPIIETEGPDLVHSWMYHSNLAVTMTSIRQPVIWGIRHSLHDIRKEKLSTRGVVRLLGLLSFRCENILYCSETSARQHEQLGFAPDKTVVIPNGFDCERYRPDPNARSRMLAELGLGRDALIIGHVARFHPMKDYETLLAAAEIVKSKAANVRLVLVGRGVEEANEALRGQIRERDLGSHVRLLGQREDVSDIMNAFDVFALSSSWGEAFPNVLGEAMACGVPCVATDVGDSANIVDGTGRIVTPGDPNALADGLRELIDLGPAGRTELGRRGRQRIQELYSIKTVTKRFRALYQRVASG